MMDAPQRDGDWERRLAGFTAWCSKLGGSMSNIRLDSSAGRGLGVFTDTIIAANEVALAIPLTAVLTVACAVRSDVGQAALGSKVLQGERVSAQALMYLVMIDGRERAESF